MAPIVAILSFAFLSLVLTYAVGTLGLGVAVFLLLGYLLISELMKTPDETART
jgi:hypothetical protein